jgi:hypothetical protein
MIERRPLRAMIKGGSSWLDKRESGAPSIPWGSSANPLHVLFWENRRLRTAARVIRVRAPNRRQG